MSATTRPVPAPLTARVLAPIAAILLAGAALAGCASGDDVPEETIAPVDASPSDETPEPSTQPSDGTGADAPTPDEERALDLEGAVASGNTAAIEHYLTDPTRVVIAASEADMQYDPVDAVLAIDYVQPGVGVWTFDLDDALLASYAASTSYGQFFPANAVVGVSDSGAVISFVPNGAKIGTIFMSIHESLITG